MADGLSCFWAPIGILPAQLDAGSAEAVPSPWDAGNGLDYGSCVAAPEGKADLCRYGGWRPSNGRWANHSLYSKEEP
jgi:hypothetical protein